MMTREFLEEEGMEVHTVPSVESALESLEQSSYDAVVSDYQMPGKSGLDLLRVIRREREDELPFIILTGKGREEVAMKALNLGANYYLQKGSDIESQYGILANSIKQEVRRRATAEMLGFTQHSIDTASVEIYWLNREGEVIYANEAASRNLGYGEQELRGLEANDIFWYSKEGNRTVLWKRLKEKKMETLESMNQRREGDTYPVEVTRQYLEFKGREYELVFSQDISKRRRVERDLISTERLYQYLFNGIPDAVILHDLSADIMAVNSEAVKRLGYSEEELLSMKVHEVMAADESVIDDRIRALLEQSSLSYEGVHLTREGKKIPVEESSRVIVYEDKPAVLITSRDITDREETERELRESRESFREMVEKSHQIFITIDQKGKIEFVNGYGLDLFGTMEEGLRGRRFNTIMPNERSGVLGADISPEDILRSPEQYEGCVIDHSGKAGGDTRIRWSFSARRDSDGEVKGLIAVGNRAGEMELEKGSAVSYRTVFETCHLPIVILDRDMTLSLVNRAFEKLSGLPRDEIEGHMNWEGFVDTDDWGAMDEYLEVLGGDQRRASKKLNFTFIDRKGDRTERSVTVEPLPNHKIALFITGADRADDEETLSRALQERGEILDTINTQIWYASNPERYGFANKARADFLGMEKEELVGKRIDDLVMESSSSECIEGNRRAFNGEFVKQEEWVRNADGELRCCLVTKIPHRDREGNVDYIVCTAEDITERREIEEQLRLANKKLNIMGSVTRHDVMNQASIIMGYQDLVKSNIEDQKLLSYLDRIEGAVEKIQKQLAFEREYERIGEEISWIDVSRVVREERAEIEAHGFLLNVEMGALHVLADSLLEKALTNIIQNSIKHSDGNEIRVHYSESDDGLDLIIEDDGTGILYEDKEKIFQRGYGAGFGYGLQMVREILDVSGMEIEETGEPGEGARFEIHIPPSKYRFD